MHAAWPVHSTLSPLQKPCNKTLQIPSKSSTPPPTHHQNNHARTCIVIYTTSPPAIPGLHLGSGARQRAGPASKLVGGELRVGPGVGAAGMWVIAGSAWGWGVGAGAGFLVWQRLLRQ